MRSLRVLLVIALAVQLESCARYYWTKPGSTVVEFAKDSQECVRASSPTQNPTVVGIETNDKAYRACLSARGYTREKKLEPVSTGWYRGVE